jgi:outer membrane receptor protein involved in Fe transport
MFFASRSARAVLALACLVSSAATAHRGDSDPPGDEEQTAETDPGAAEAIDYQTIVTGKRELTAASSRRVRDRDFLLRARLRPADILQAVPGLYVNQHAGGGKANQYFLRGFDADHGTDVLLTVDGVPVNMVSHGHGQGYADLNWVIPELVKRVEVHKGPYSAEHGDFATAGAVNLVTRDDAESNQLTLEAGSFNTYRALVVTNPGVGDLHTLLAGQAYGTDGPFQSPERLQRYSLFSRVTARVAPSANLAATFTAYGSGWNASGQVPNREVSAGRLDPFGSVDPTEGGGSQRHAAQLALTAATDDGGDVLVMAYLAQYRLSLFSNFTFFSADPVNGDMIEQRDERTLGGLSGRYRFLHRAGKVELRGTFGIQLRTDSISNSLYRSRARERLAPAVDARIRQGSLGLYAQEDVRLTPWLRAVVGLRADTFGFDVDDRLEDLETLGARGSGVRQASILSPKASLIVDALPSTTLFLNYGHGFHSNDARGTTRSPDPVTPLTRAIGAELGARTALFDRVDVAGALFLLDLESEIVWVGDEGTTEARGPTRRVGAEAELRLTLLPWLFADADATVSRATFTRSPPDANAVPLAPTLIVGGGISARHPLGISGRVGLLHLADRPATEDRFLVAQGFTRVDATLGYRHRLFEVNLSVQNLADTRWREAQFANVSRLPHEVDEGSCPPGTRPVSADGAFLGCEDLHFTPGAPINARVSLTAYF